MKKFLIIPIVLIAILIAVNYSFFIVVSSSMEPKYPVNSIVIIKPVKFSSLAVGDVIVFKSDALKGKFAFHRITRITAEGVYTKGDRNKFEDSQLITKESYVGKGVLSITFMAGYLTSLKTPQGFILLFLMPLLAIILFFYSMKLLKT